MPLEEARTAEHARRLAAAAAARLPLAPDEAVLLGADEWAEIAIVSAVQPGRRAAPRTLAGITPAPGSKCVRCWRVLAEVGRQANHPTLCARCADAVDSGLVCRPAA